MVMVMMVVMVLLVMMVVMTSSTGNLRELILCQFCQDNVLSTGRWLKNREHSSPLSKLRLYK